MRIEKAKLKDIIRKIRTESAISRLRLGIECNRAEKTIKNLETESDPRWSTVMAVASALDMDLGDLNPCIGKPAPKKKD
ncbi:MAG: hypothetical protein HFE30_01385 [Clostridiales bacterium]|nr:hypothetical protein [Clostridiales bacterium]